MTDTPVPLQCDEALTCLEAAVDGELDATAVAGLEHHLAACPACAAEMDRARQVRDQLRALPLLDPPPDLTRAVLAAAFEQPAPHRRPARMFLGLAATLVLAILVGVIWLGRGSGAPAAPSPTEIAHATFEARYAFAVVGRASRQAAAVVRIEAFDRGLAAPSVSALHRVLPRAHHFTSATPPAAAAPAPAPTDPARS